MKKMRSGFLIALLILLGLPVLLSAQTAEIPFHDEAYNWKSRIHNGDGLRERLAESHTVRAQGAPWLRLYFGNLNLGPKSHITITSLQDGATQNLNAQTLTEWQNTSAYFNGDAIKIEIYVDTNAQGIFLEVPQVMVGDWVSGQPQPLSQCGPTDDRTPSTHPASGRLLSVGCTGWIVSNGLHITAGHCSGGAAQTLQFNVPPSNPDGTLNHPGPQDQYSVDPASKQSVNGGIGNDWGVFEVFDNSQTGLQPIDAQGASFTVVQDLGPANIRITGFGVDNNDPTRNQTQQTHLGPNFGSAGTTMRYQTDTEGGNSGSPVIDDATGNAVGVHTHGGCSVGGGGNNSGTSTFNTAFWNALNVAPPNMAVTMSNLNPPPPITIPPGGGTISYTGTLTNSGGSPTTGDIWSMVTLPNGNQFGPTVQFNGVPFSAGQTRASNVSETLPPNAPPGSYTYELNFGTFPNTVTASDQFTFTKSTVKPASAPVVQTNVSLDANVDFVAYGNWSKLVTEVAFIPEAFVVEQNYPNPFNPSTVIRYGLHEDTQVSVKIFDMLGKEVATLVNAQQKAGFKSITWNGKNDFGQPAPAGIYLYRVEAAGLVQVKKMILTK
ncbi:MAG: T9SS type A sorting domain-containing protein [bacterium]